MNRIFGRAKPKEPAPNMGDMILKVRSFYAYTL